MALGLMLIALMHVINASEEIRYCAIGLGHFGRLATTIALKKNVNIVAAFTRSSNIGKDVGDVLNIGYKLNVPISPVSDLDKILKETRPNICFDATATTLAEVYENYLILLKNKVNIISLAEQHVYPFNAKNYDEISKLAIEQDVTIFGAGFQDLYLQQYFLALSSSMISIFSIDAGWYGDFNTDVFVYSEYVGIGLTENEFHEKKINDPEENIFSRLMSEWTIAMSRWYAKQFDLTEVDYQMTIAPILNTDDGVYGKVVDRLIQKGENLGLNMTLSMKTKEGVDIYFRNEVRCYNDGEQKNAIEIVMFGEPDRSSVVVPRIDVGDGTIITAINRIPQIIEAKGGYYNVDELGLAKYWSGVQNVCKDDKCD